MILKYDSAYYEWLLSIEKTAENFKSELIYEINEEIKQQLIYRKQENCVHEFVEDFISLADGYYRLYCEQMFVCPKCKILIHSKFNCKHKSCAEGYKKELEFLNENNT